MQDHVGKRFHKLATPENAMSHGRMFFWDARGVYVGEAFGLRPHRNAVAVLCVALDAPCRLARDPLRSDAGQVEFRTALIPPNTMHHLQIPMGNRMGFVYVDGLSEDYSRLRLTMRDKAERFSTGLTNESNWIDVLTKLADGESWRTSMDSLTSLLGAARQRPCDDRISNAISNQRMSPSDRHSLIQAAAEAGLSQSRFLHLFKIETGLPFRRYRLWMRIGTALGAMRRGSTMTESAFTAGFSSSAHFATAFTTMFGMPPSRLGHLLQPSKAPSA